MSKNSFNITSELFTQILLGLFIAMILTMAKNPLPVSLFVGLLGALALGWFTETNKTSPTPPSVGSNEGIDAGLKYWLFFLLGFVVLGYRAPMSILLGAIAGFGGGWIIAWWQSKEDTRTQVEVEVPDTLTEEASTRQPATKRRFRKINRRFRRPSGIKLKFWEK
ncbi:hypothetical protein [Calothrix sp. 336/3]|uniref:hypothetical protein n=1 Tax=Calothrix sp. 336/3 TaxID=1337936 RepID=UPI0004E297AB|nr:hypothetical protein [Calothrix sp. 336/3]AKG22605.1 hypothetical protein IJ00_16205 [Calothrix sp. 336/3]